MGWLLMRTVVKVGASAWGWRLVGAGQHAALSGVAVSTLAVMRAAGLASPNPYLRMQLAQVEIEGLSLARAVAATLAGLTALVAISSALPPFAAQVSLQLPDGFLLLSPVHCSARARWPPAVTWHRGASTSESSALVELLLTWGVAHQSPLTGGQRIGAVPAHEGDAVLWHEGDFSTSRSCIIVVHERRQQSRQPRCARTCTC